MPQAIKDNQIVDIKENDWDYSLDSTSRIHGSHTSLVPLSSNAQSQRLFYAARFLNQAMPLQTRETPLVQSLDPDSKDGLSFEEQCGRRAGARFFDDDDGEVIAVSSDAVTVKLPDGSKKDIDLYNNFQFNRKTFIHNKPLVKVGDKLKKGQIVASSNYTDDNGTLAMGRNARIAMVPYKGYSMDDAIVVSEDFAKKMISEHNYEHNQAKDLDTKFGRDHYVSLFPKKFTKEQLANLDANGMALPGTVLHKGDPIMLATRPKPVYSNASHLGKLGRVFKSIRSDAAEVWNHDYPGTVTDVVDGKKARKVYVSAMAPLEVGDKLTIRNGQKSIVSKILSSNEMLRSLDGKPYDVLLNPLALPSRVNTSTLYEMLYGKIAQKNGAPVKVPAYMEKGKSRLDHVLKELEKAGLPYKEEVFDPAANRKLEKPISTGVAYVYKLHHVVASKRSARGNGSYDQNEQPLRGSSDSAQAKRLGGLETTALMAKGAYATIRDGATVRGQKNDDWWRAVRQGYRPSAPGVPFVFDKFRALLNGAGMNPKDLGKGKLRLSPLTDADLESRNPIEIANGKMVKQDTLEAIAGGLFDPRMVAGNRWGKVTLPTALPNPAMEGQIALLLGIKVADLRKVIAGEAELSEVRKRK